MDDQSERMARTYADMNEHLRDALQLMQDGWLVERVVKPRERRPRGLTLLGRLTRRRPASGPVVVTYTRSSREAGSDQA